MTTDQPTDRRPPDAERYFWQPLERQYGKHPGGAAGKADMSDRFAGLSGEELGELFREIRDTYRYHNFPGPAVINGALDRVLRRRLQPVRHTAAVQPWIAKDWQATSWAQAAMRASPYLDEARGRWDRSLWDELWSYCREHLRRDLDPGPPELFDLGRKRADELRRAGVAFSPEMLAHKIGGAAAPTKADEPDEYACPF